ncbi:unnamed protein product [Didymodactylos carnosus]|uniref:Uncharacterized protein n=1 Tax=Didymodactylos carnosus TaxID=1234261 RepID=A0A815CJ26_9BILA|nr:unnamed protein product [Didymodactylos carnosus]CAF4083546.1 unnamed protein product [Didymodactylos carnosus]
MTSNEFDSGPNPADTSAVTLVQDLEVLCKRCYYLQKSNSEMYDYLAKGDQELLSYIGENDKILLKYKKKIKDILDFLKENYQNYHLPMNITDLIQQEEHEKQVCDEKKKKMMSETIYAEKQEEGIFL